MRLVLLSILLCPASFAWAYVTPDGDRTRWRQAPQPGIARLSTDLPADGCRMAFEAAFATWSGVDGAPLPLPLPIDGPGDLTIGFVADRPDLVGVVGVTLTTTEGAGAARRIVRAEVMLNDDFNWSIEGPRGTFRVQATATHEIGHALGLGHSADRAATMYWHYDVNGAALNEDDRRGLRFLYGEPSGQGRSCDQCAVAADCAGGICLQRFNEGDRAYCARACEGGCDVDEICAGLRNGGDACVPANGFCGDGGGLPSDAACWGPFQCTAPDRCVVSPGDARCSPPCGGPGECGAGRVCALDPFDLPRVCQPPGPAALGEGCGWATDCASGVCLPSGVCGQWCTDACPAGWRCAANAHWPDAPRVCQRAPADMGLPDTGVQDAATEMDAALDATADAMTDPADAQANFDAEPISDLRGDAAPSADGGGADAGSIDPPATPPQDSGCVQQRGPSTGWWIGWVLALGWRRTRLR